MKRKYSALSDKVKLIGILKADKRKIDYYIVLPGNSRIYAFTRAYTKNSYDLCKAGISIKNLLQKRTRDTGITNLIKYTAYMMPYFLDEYELI